MIILFTLCVLTNGLQSICNKEYGKKNQCSAFFFTLIASIISLCFFLLRSGFSFDFDSNTILCGIACGVGAIASLAGGNLAIRNGPLSVSGLIKSLSLGVPIVFGIVFLSEPIGKWFFLGITLLVLSLTLVNLKKEGKSINLRWVLWIIVAFAGNALFATVQKVHQFSNGGLRANELMIVAYTFSAISLLVYVLIYEKEKIKVSFKRAPFAVGYGLLNATTNLCILLLAPIASAALVYPLMTGCDLIIVSLLSLIIYKEKLTLTQWIGVGLGIISAVLLSI